MYNLQAWKAKRDKFYSAANNLELQKVKSKRVSSYKEKERSSWRLMWKGCVA